MRKDDALRHAHECRQWAATARDPNTRTMCLDAAKTWDQLAQEIDVLGSEGSLVGLSSLVSGLRGHREPR